MLLFFPNNFQNPLPLILLFSFKRERNMGEWSVKTGVSISVIVKILEKYSKLIYSRVYDSLRECFCVKVNRLEFIFLTLHISHNS